MQFGKLRHTVELLDFDTSKDAHGHTLRFYSKFATVKADIRGQYGIESAYAERIESRTMYRLIMRYRSDIKPQQRILWKNQCDGDKVLEIQYATDMQGRRRMTTILAIEVTNDNAPVTMTNTVAPVASGQNNVIGATLSVTTGTWSETPDVYTYQWYADGVAISGATSSTYIVIAGNVNDAFYCAVTAKKAGYVNVSADSNTLDPVASPWTPADITTTAWYAASDTDSIISSGGLVSQWNDKSGNAYHMVQATGSKQPSTGTRTVDGTNVIDFDGGSIMSSAGLGAALTGLNREFSVFSVFNVDTDTALDGYAWMLGSTTDNDPIVYLEGNTNNDLLGWDYTLRNDDSLSTKEIFGTAADNSVHVHSSVFGSTNLDAKLDGADLYDSSRVVTGTQTMNNFSIGGLARTSEFTSLDGAVAELIIVDGAMTTDVRQKAEGYLAWQWGLEGNLPVGHPYKSAPPTV